MWMEGQKVKLKSGLWVYSQSASQRLMDRWTKIQIIAPVNAHIESVCADGWLILLETAKNTRYKTWPTALEQ
jgi:hypothetical protein